MTLPGHVIEGVERALDETGMGKRIESTVAVGGGCINNGARIETDSGVTLFLKWHPTAPAEMFEAEANGLAALRDARAVRVPEPLAWGGGEARSSWLLLEYVAPGTPTPEADARLGRGLAVIHAASPSAQFGWDRDNWIGSLPQQNGTTRSWADFWRDHRIAPQLAVARRRGHLSDPVLDRLIEVIPPALEDVDRPELLHGDLWAGNAFASDIGEPVIVDPAVYRGHGEVDLAMTELFGGFGAPFYDAYAESHGISSAYHAYRRDLYQLYYLLVHVNLFGASYEAGSLRAARCVVAELG